MLLSGLLTALLCLPGLPVALRQIPSYRNPNLVVPPVGDYLAELARVYGLGEHLDAAVAQPWVWALVGWLVIGWVLGLVMWGRGDTATRRRGGRGRIIAIDPSAMSHLTSTYFKNRSTGDASRSFVIRSSPSPGPSYPFSFTTWSSVIGQLLPHVTSVLRCRVGCCWAGWRCAAGRRWGAGPARWPRSR